MDRFLTRSGLSPADLKVQPPNPRHLTAILDFLITDESALQEFSRTVDLPPEAAYEARRLVGGRPSRRPELAVAEKAGADA